MSGGHVFISYSSKDKAVADAICALLERDGLACWIAPRDILPGQGWEASIVRAIGAARAFVLLYSGPANASGQVQREVSLAANHELPIIPFRLEDVPPSETLEYYMLSPHWLDALDPPLERHIERLSTVVRRLLDLEGAPQAAGTEVAAAPRADAAPSALEPGPPRSPPPVGLDVARAEVPNAKPEPAPPGRQPPLVPLVMGGVALVAVAALAVVLIGSHKAPTSVGASTTVTQPAAPEATEVAPTQYALALTLAGHTDQVFSVDFSPDGSRIVSGSADRTVRIWDAATGRQVGAPLTGHTGAVSSVAFSPDSSRIASGSHDATIRFWDPATGGQIGPSLTGHTQPVHSVAFSPDGQRLVSGSGDNTVRIWDAASGREIGAPLTGHSAAVYAVAFSPDGHRIVSGSYDKTLRIWDATSGQQIGAPLVGHAGFVVSVAFSPDGRRIVSGAFDGIRLWDADTGQQVGPPLIGTRVDSVAFSRDGQRIVSGGGDKTIRIWDVASRQQIGPPLTGPTALAPSVAFSPDGRRIVAGSEDDLVRVWVAAGP